MRVFNEDKTLELTNYDLEKGYLQSDKLFIAHHEPIQAVEEQGHYETMAEYPNGGKDVKWVVDVAAVKAQEAYDEYEDIQVYIPYTPLELKERAQANLRAKREVECFPVINRGKLWYDRLSQDELSELQTWYTAWLNVTETLIVPIKPTWIDLK